MYILLIFIGVSLVILNAKAIKKEKKSFKSTFDTASANMEDVDLMLLEVRREFAETITELQREILDLKDIVEKLLKIDTEDILEQNVKDSKDVEINKLNKINNKIENFHNSSAQEFGVSYNKENDKIISSNLIEKNSPNIKYEMDNEVILDGHVKDTLASGNLKIEDVKNLFNEGLTLDEIASRLNIGKGEVLLIKELYLR